jgi:hypothetical protein
VGNKLAFTTSAHSEKVTAYSRFRVDSARKLFLRRLRKEREREREKARERERKRERERERKRERKREREFPNNAKLQGTNKLAAFFSQTDLLSAAS